MIFSQLRFIRRSVGTLGTTYRNVLKGRTQFFIPKSICIIPLFGISEQINEEQKELKNMLMRLKMDMEFTSKSIVSEKCLSICLHYIQTANPQESHDLARLISSYNDSNTIHPKQDIHKQSDKQQAQTLIIRLCEKLSRMSAFLKEGNIIKSSEEMDQVEQLYSSINLHLNKNDQIQIISQIVFALIQQDRLQKCSKYIEHLCHEICLTFENNQNMNDEQLEEVYQALLFFVDSLVKNNKGDQIKELISKHLFLDINWLQKHSEKIPIAFLPPPLLLFTLSNAFLKESDRQTAREYLCFAADLVQQIEGTNSDNYKYLSSKIIELS